MFTSASAELGILGSILSPLIVIEAVKNIVSYLVKYFDLWEIDGDRLTS